MSAERRHTRDLLLIVVKFAILAPVCLFLWWAVVPWYGRFVGEASALLLNIFFGQGIQAVQVEAAGLLNTETKVAFLLAESRPSMPVAHLVTNAAPYVALILSTGGLGLKRRAKALWIGLAILAAGHVFLMTILYLVNRAAAANPDQPTQLPAALVVVFHTLPFGLWIVLGYWDRISALFDAPQTTS